MLSLVVALAAVLAADEGAQPAPTPPLIQPPPPRIGETQRIELKDAKDGSGDLVYEASAFTARIAPDGSVAFKDKRISGWQPFGYMPMDAKMGVPSLQSSLRALRNGRAPPRSLPTEIDEGLAPPETKQLIPEVSRYRPDPREGCRNCSTMFNELAVPVQAFGRFDVTDELMRFADEDPYRYQKAVFLAATRDRRIQMAVATHTENTRRAADELPARLQAIACDTRLTYKERRAIFVALAREMDLSTPAGAAGANAVGEFVKRFDAGGVTCAGSDTATPN